MGLITAVVGPLSCSAAAIVASILIVFLLYWIGVCLYNITLHPLARFPGPKLRGASNLFQAWDIWSGDVVANWAALHDKYGDVVRIGPSRLSFIRPEAWQDIYGQTASSKQVPKDKDFYFDGQNDETPDLFSADDATHARMRKLLNPAFSEAAIREQEPLLNSYFDLLLRRLDEKIDGPEHGKVDIARWLNFTTFDIIGDLLFAESFNSLHGGEYHAWVAQIFDNLKFTSVFQIMHMYPLIGIPFLRMCGWFPSLQKARTNHFAFTNDRMIRRLDMHTDRKDIVSYITKDNNGKGMSRAEIKKLAGSLIVAGSETSATVLSGAVFNLLQNPFDMGKLVDELRSNFADTASMSVGELARLPYLNACIRESMRIYPAVPGVMPRQTGAGGASVAGHFVPENVKIGVLPWSVYRSSKNFLNPDAFRPERWLGDEKYKDDKRNALQPFAVGPRNCSGQHLAWAEMRAILARLLWSFDLELSPESTHWNKQKVFILWEKPSLMVKVHRRKW